MTSSRWPTHDYANRRFLLEREAIRKLVSDTEAMGGNSLCALSLLDKKEKGYLVDNGKMDDFEWKDLECILTECEKGKDLAPIEAEENVRNL